MISDHSRPSAVVTIVLIVGLIVGLIVAPAPAVAANATNTTATPAPNATATPTDGGFVPDVEIGVPDVEVGGQSTETPQSPEYVTIDGMTAIEDYSLENGQMTLVVRSKVPQRISITDVGMMQSAVESDSGVYDLSIWSWTLDKGVNRRSIDVEVVDGEGHVSIVTQRERGVVVSTGESSGSVGEPVPFGWAAIMVSLAAIGAGGLAFVWSRRRLSADERWRDRIA